MKIALTLLLSLFSFMQVNAQDSTLSQYTGVFKFPDGSAVTEVTVTMENGGLQISSSAGNSALEKTGVDSFYITSFEGTAIFLRGQDKKIKGIYIEARGVILDGVKEQPKQSMALIRKRIEIPQPFNG